MHSDILPAGTPKQIVRATTKVGAYHATSNACHCHEHTIRQRPRRTRWHQCRGKENVAIVFGRSTSSCWKRCGTRGLKNTGRFESDDSGRYVAHRISDIAVISPPVDAAGNW